MKNKLIRLFNRLRGLEDYVLRDYELETLHAIRQSSWKLSWYSTEVLTRLYHEYSTITYFAGWMEHNDKLIKNFIAWATTRPIDVKIDLSPYQNMSRSDNWKKYIRTEDITHFNPATKEFTNHKGEVVDKIETDNHSWSTWRYVDETWVKIKKKK